MTGCLADYELENRLIYALLAKDYAARANLTRKEGDVALLDVARVRVPAAAAIATRRRSTEVIQERLQHHLP